MPAEKWHVLYPRQKGIIKITFLEEGKREGSLRYKTGKCTNTLRQRRWGQTNTYFIWTRKESNSLPHNPTNKGHFQSDLGNYTQKSFKFCSTLCWSYQPLEQKQTEAGGRLLQPLWMQTVAPRKTIDAGCSVLPCLLFPILWSKWVTDLK